MKVTQAENFANFSIFALIRESFCQVKSEIEIREESFSALKRTRSRVSHKIELKYEG